MTPGDVVGVKRSEYQDGVHGVHVECLGHDSDGFEVNMELQFYGSPEDMDVFERIVRATMTVEDDDEFLRTWGDE